MLGGGGGGGEEMVRNGQCFLETSPSGLITGTEDFIGVCGPVSDSSVKHIRTTSVLSLDSRLSAIDFFFFLSVNL